MLIKTLLVKLGIDTGDYIKGLSDAKEATGGTVGSIVSNLSKVGGAVVLGGLALAAAGVVALGAGLGIAITEAMGAQEVMAQTQAVIQSTGGAAGMTAEQIGDLATALSLQSRFSDDAIQKGENLLLTFTNIGADVFPLATQAMVDMAAAMGTDVSGGAIQLGKALNDPIAGISALSRVGVTFTEDQKKVIEALVATGDVAGAQKIIIEELNKEFGGSAAAAAATFGGQLDVLRNRLLNVAEGIGLQLLPVLMMLFDTVIVPAIPVIEAFGQVVAVKLTGTIQQFVGFVTTNLPAALAAFQSTWAWLQANEGIFVGIFAALAVAVGAFVWTTVIPGAIATIAALAPIVLPLIAIAAVVALLYTAWDQNWGGIRDVLTAFWTGSGQPLLAQLQAWLGTNIPIALALLAQFWTGTLQPAMAAVMAFLQGNVVPALLLLRDWLAVTIPAAITTLKGFWENTLLPAIRAVWAFIQDPLLPLFRALVDFWNAAFTLALTALAGLWQNVLQPALKVVVDYVVEHLQPVFATLVTFWNETLGPALTTLKNGVLAQLPGVFTGIRDAIQWVIDKISIFTSALSNVQLPWWLTPGSPTPFELGLRGVASAMDDLARRELPSLSARLNLQPVVVGQAGGAAPATNTRTNIVNAQYAYQSEDEVAHTLKLLDRLD